MSAKLIHHETARRLTARVGYVLFTALLAVGNVCAEDDVTEYDPNGNFAIFDFLRDLWDCLVKLIA